MAIVISRWWKVGVFSVTLPFFALAGCSGSSNDQDEDDGGPDAADFAVRLADADAFADMQSDDGHVKFLLPTQADNVPVELTDSCYFQKSSKYKLHLEFLRLFPSQRNLTGAQYSQLVEPRDRALFAGDVFSSAATVHPITGKRGVMLYSILTSETDTNLQPSVEDMENLYDTLKSCVPYAADYISMVAITSVQESALEAMADELSARSIPWLKLSDLDRGIAASICSHGESYGFLKLFPEGETIEDTGRFDIALGERVSNDLSLVGGVVTALPQSCLSHVNIRLQEKGLPSAQLPNLYDNPVLASWEGKLVHIDTTGQTVLIEPATREQMDDWYDNNGPSAGVPSADLSVTELKLFDDMRHQDVIAFGAKAANLGELHQALGAEQAVAGMGIPFSWYDSFMKANGLYDKVDALLADERVFTDAEYRDDALDELREAIEDGEFSDEMLTQLDSALVDHFGDSARTTRMRFRSSTNAEDLEAFSGAGLYDSKSGCLADSLDDDKDGPSRCLDSREKAVMEAELARRKQEFEQYPDRTWLEDIIDDIEGDLSKEKPMEKGLRKVWASLWNLRAFEEREYYKIPHKSVYMGIALNRSFRFETRESIVVTNVPDSADSAGRAQYRISSQLGSIGVARPDDPTARAEEMTLYREAGTPGTPVNVNVNVYSSLSPEAPLWNEAALLKLTNMLFVAHDHFANNVYDNLQSPAFDMEVEVVEETEGQETIYIKQARPYLAGN